MAIQLQPPCSEQGHPQLSQAAQSMAEGSTSWCHLGIHQAQRCHPFHPRLLSGIVGNGKSWARTDQNIDPKSIGLRANFTGSSNKAFFLCCFTSLSLVFPKVTKYLEVLEFTCNIKPKFCRPQKDWNCQTHLQLSGAYPDQEKGTCKDLFPGAGEQPVSLLYPSLDQDWFMGC